jgi:hypothetical protein
MGHTKGRQGTGGIGQEKQTKNLNVVDVLMYSLYRNEYRNFKTGQATMGSGLGRREED